MRDASGNVPTLTTMIALISILSSMIQNTVASMLMGAIEVIRLHVRPAKEEHWQ